MKKALLPTLVGFMLVGALGDFLGGSRAHADEPSSVAVRADYLLWWMKSDFAPPLLSSGNRVLSGINAGRIGNPDTIVLLGGGDLDNDVQHGVRLNIDTWFEEEEWGLNVSGFWLDRENSRLTTLTDTNDVLSIPFFNTQAGNSGEAVERLSSLGAFQGNADTTLSNRLWGTEINFKGKINASDADYRIFLIGGIRHADLNEQIKLHTRTQLLAQGLAGYLGDFLLEGDVLDVREYFAVRNQFIGGQIGAVAELNFQPLYVNLAAKIAVGTTHRKLSIQGDTSLSIAGVLQDTTTGGHFAQATNIGTHTDNEFSLLPELNMNVSYEITEWLRVHVGYSILYWTDVIRPGQIIDRNINFAHNPRSIPFAPAAAPATPTVLRPDSDFWAQGVNFGVEIRY